MLLPEPRGPITEQLQGLRSGESPDVQSAAVAVDAVVGPVLHSDDAQLALWQLYELHYQGFDDVDAHAEWSPDVMAITARLERRFEAELRELTRAEVKRRRYPADVPIGDRLFAMVRDDDAPRLAQYVHRNATREQLCELLVHRSIYNLKEADPHTFAVPRLNGRAKAALMEIQFDEYGAGRSDDMHSALFGGTMTSCGLDSTYGAYVDAVPGYTLAASNAMTLFALHRRLRGAAVGHLAAFEATSTLPNRRLAAGIRRLGYGDVAARYFDEHVEADAVHEQIAVRELCGALVAEEPDCEDDVLFGAATCLAVDAFIAGKLLHCWGRGESTLLRPVAGHPASGPATARPSPEERPTAGGHPLREASG